MRRRFLYSLLCCVLAVGCVGQKDDPEPEPQPEPVPGPVVPDPEPDPDPDPNPDPDPPAPPDPDAPFFHRVLALEFTATWCQYCPNMAEALEEAAGQRPDRLVTVAVHYADELAPEESMPLVTAFKVSSYPTLIPDCDGKTLLAEQSAEKIVSLVDKALETPACGLAAQSAVADDGTLTVTVRVKSVSAGDYSVALAHVEDGIVVDYQAGYGSNYCCNDVLRGYLDAGMEGKSLGTLQEGEEGTAVFTAPAPEKGRLVLYVLCGGKAVNALTLGLNEQKEYGYEESAD